MIELLYKRLLQEVCIGAFSLISVCHFRYEKVAHACFLLITTTHFEYRHFFLSELLPSTTIRTLALVTADFHSQNIAVR